MIISWKKMFSPFDPVQGVECVYKAQVFACMLLYASFPLILYVIWSLSKEKKYPTPGIEVVRNIKIFDFKCMLSYV